MNRDSISQNLTMDILHYNYIEISSNYLGSLGLDISPLLAQTFDNVDILGDMQIAWQNFVETGQVWALITGVFIGYVFKGFTSY